MIDWVGCTTVMIGRPSPKTFPSILNICMRPVDVGAAAKGMAGLRARARYPESSGSNAGSKFSLGRRKIELLSADDISASHRIPRDMCTRLVGYSHNQEPNR